MVLCEFPMFMGGIVILMSEIAISLGLNSDVPCINYILLLLQGSFLSAKTTIFLYDYMKLELSRIKLACFLCEFPIFHR